MYSLPPIVSHTTPMDLPSTMYQLPVIQGGTESSEVQRGQCESSDLLAFERRQEALLGRLQHLQGSVRKLRESVGLADSTTKKGNYGVSIHPTDSSLNLVVRASPTHPPLALLCAAKQLKSNLDNSVTINCHAHSSLGNTIVPKNLASDFTSECGGGSNRGLKFKLTVVWKDVGKDPESVIGVDTFICGEANILRYISRRLPNEFPYEVDPAFAFKVDQALDIVHRRIVWGDDMQSALKIMDGALKVGGGVSIISGSGSLTIADYIAWSAMVNTGAADTKLASVSKWAKTVFEVAGRTPSRHGSGNRKNSARIRRKTKSTRGDSEDKSLNSDSNKTGKENKSKKWRIRRKSSSKSKSKSGSPQP